LDCHPSVELTGEVLQGVRSNPHDHVGLFGRQIEIRNHPKAGSIQQSFPEFRINDGIANDGL
jgi:hypothetical protein